MRATVAVTADGEPVDDAARALMILQNAEAEKAKHNIQEDYTIVYIPPNFRSRVIAFITMLWMIGAICVGFVVALPLSLGRSFFRLFTPRDIHDGYSFIIGFYLIWLCYLIAHAIDRLDRRRKRRSGEGPRAELGLLVVKRGLLWFAKMIYMAFFLGIAIPILLAVVVDLYIVLPIRFAVDPALVPKIKIVDQWALGLLYAKIAIYVQRIQPPTRISRGLQQIQALGWTRPDPVLATKEVIAPLVGGLAGMIIIPGVVFKVATSYFSDLVQDNRFICTLFFYKSILVLSNY
jgi:E3 ubiquitin-protein ligase MARCH6